MVLIQLERHTKAVGHSAIELYDNLRVRAPQIGCLCQLATSEHASADDGSHAKHASDDVRSI